MYLAEITLTLPFVWRSQYSWIHDWLKTSYTLNVLWNVLNYDSKLFYRAYSKTQHRGSAMLFKPNAHQKPQFNSTQLRIPVELSWVVFCCTFGFAQIKALTRLQLQPRPNISTITNSHYDKAIIDTTNHSIFEHKNVHYPILARLVKFAKKLTNCHLNKNESIDALAMTCWIRLRSSYP